MNPSREDAWRLVELGTRSQGLRRHMRSVEIVMRAYAVHLGEDPERWGRLGLIHDWDYEEGPSPEQHPLRGNELLRGRGWPEDLLQDIASHADRLGVTRNTPIRRALYAVDELSGFMIACALVQPNHSLAALDAAAVRRKMKDRSFARGVHRESMLAGAEALGVDFDTHVVFVRDALIPFAVELGLNP
ncbi:MAG TPA: hypothetical protein VMU49_03035 [Candidatus Acidoferrales bacterium]|nr:hypothetical protein [Candidatus Acidoferrales bacterium]